MPPPGFVMRTSMFFLESVITLSLIGLVFYSFRDMLSTHIQLGFFFLPLSVGLHGSVSSTISSSLASGTPLRLNDWLAVVWEACLSDSRMASAVALCNAFVGLFMPGLSTQAGLIAAIALPFAASWRNVLAGLFPLLSVRLGLDPADTAMPLMSAIGNPSAFFLFLSLARVLLHVVPAFW